MSGIGGSGVDFSALGFGIYASTSRVYVCHWGLGFRVHSLESLERIDIAHLIYRSTNRLTLKSLCNYAAGFAP